ncbi:MAG: hypothetical protein ACRDWW_02590 [Acidimicrobiales bacterium]
MVKRKITVTVDENLVEDVKVLGTDSLSAVVNSALASELERRSRAVALKRLIEDWDGRLGPVHSEVAEAAGAAFDDLDATAELRPPAPRQRRRRQGAA